MTAGLRPGRPADFLRRVLCVSSVSSATSCPVSCALCSRVSFGLVSLLQLLLAVSAPRPLSQSCHSALCFRSLLPFSRELFYPGFPRPATQVRQKPGPHKDRKTSTAVGLSHLYFSCLFSASMCDTKTSECLHLRCVCSLCVPARGV